MMKKNFYSIASACFLAGNTWAAQPAPEPCVSCSAQILQGITWNYVLSKPPSLSVPADAYDIDGFDSSADLVSKIHANNGKAICYVSAGTWEDWRPDADSFPETVLGKENGWPGEKWLDIRQTAILLPILQARLDICVQKGFDAVEWDNVDGYSNKTGFPLTADDQLTFNSLIANIAHQTGLAVGLKNDIDQIPDLVSYFDFAVNEQCFEYDECDTLTPFIDADKAVLNVEYNLKPAQFCPEANEMHFSSIKKDLDLTEPVTFCN